MFVEQNPHIDYAALIAAVEEELRRPRRAPLPPAPMPAPGAETRGPEGRAARIAARLRRWPWLYRAARRAWPHARAAAAAVRRRPRLHYLARWARWFVSLPTLADRFAAQAIAIDQLRAELHRAEGDARAMRDALLEALAETREHSRALAERTAREEVFGIAAEVAAIRRRLASGNVGAQPAGSAPPAAPISAAMARFYQEFEDAWRGDVAVIRERVAHYLPAVREAGAGGPQAPIADLGCGRGEWLGLLRDEGLVAVGVDSNAEAVERCAAQGLTVSGADLMSWLGARPDSSLGAVSAFHVVEHLPFEVLVAMLDEALRALRPGGLLILETPDPANLLVATQSFWLDPSHIRPIPADLLAFTTRARGFDVLRVERLHPGDQTQRFEAGDEVADRLDGMLYGPQDYAVVARKPA